MKNTYFAYGTLLDVDNMRQSCPSASPVGVMRLRDYRLGFATCAADTAHGGCTLEPAPGGIMYGLLYKMHQEELNQLHQSAGVDQGLWDLIRVTLVDEKETEHPADTYTILNTVGPWVPPDSYVEPILKGARNLGLPRDYVDKLQEIIKAFQIGN